MAKWGTWYRPIKIWKGLFCYDSLGKPITGWTWLCWICHFEFRYAPYIDLPTAYNDGIKHLTVKHSELLKENK